MPTYYYVWWAEDTSFLYGVVLRDPFFILQKSLWLKNDGNAFTSS